MLLKLDHVCAQDERYGIEVFIVKRVKWGSFGCVNVRKQYRQKDPESIFIFAEAFPATQKGCLVIVMTNGFAKGVRTM